MLKEVVITVAGTTCSGKTFTSVAIEKALRDAGFTVTLVPNMDQDQDMKRKWLEDPEYSEKIKSVFNQINVTIVEHQLNRQCATDENALIDYISLIPRHPLTEDQQKRIKECSDRLKQVVAKLS